jgi:hypothetical protein
MRGGMGRWPRQDDEWDPGLYKFLLYLSPDVYMDTGLFRPVPGKRDPGMCNRDPASTGTFSSM